MSVISGDLSASHGMATAIGDITGNGEGLTTSLLFPPRDFIDSSSCTKNICVTITVYV
jgi:hypothetical protein